MIAKVEQQSNGALLQIYIEPRGRALTGCVASIALPRGLGDLELGSNKGEREANHEEGGKADSHGHLARGTRGEGQRGLVGVLDVQVSSEQRSLLLTQSSAGGANGLAGEHGHVD